MKSQKLEYAIAGWDTYTRKWYLEPDRFKSLEEAKSALAIVSDPQLHRCDWPRKWKIISRPVVEWDVVYVVTRRSPKAERKRGGVK